MNRAGADQQDRAGIGAKSTACAPVPPVAAMMR